MPKSARPLRSQGGQLPIRNTPRMILYLVQHGQAEPEGERPLTEEGRETVRAVSRLAAGAGLRPGALYHSGKLRARQTAEILGQAMEVEALELAGLAPLDPVAPVARLVEAWGEQGLESVALVGHLPFLDRLASLLIRGDEGAGAVSFRNGALVALSPAGEGERWFLDFTLQEQG